jgi:hypothetical protein
MDTDRIKFNECMGDQATHDCTVEAQVKLAHFSLLLQGTHHAFYEDNSSWRILPLDVISC